MIVLANALLNGVPNNALMTMNLIFGLIISNVQIQLRSKSVLTRNMRVHNAQKHKTISNQVRKVCENKTSSKWMLGKSLLHELGSLREDSEVLPSDWICGGCFNSAIYTNNTEPAR